MLKTCAAPNAEEISYHLLGKRGRNALFLLGGPGPSLWLPIAEGLKSRYLLIIPDLLKTSARNDAENNSTTIPRIAEQIREISTVEKLDRIGVVGWSMGTQAAVALSRLCSQQTAGLVFLCGTAEHVLGIPLIYRRLPDPFNIANKIPADPSRLAAHLDRIDRLRVLLKKIKSPARLAKRFGLIDPLTEDEAFDTVVNDFLSISLKVYHCYASAAAEFDGPSAALQFQFPMLAVSGEKDLFVTPRQMRAMAERLPGCEYFEVKGGTHYLPVEYGELLALKIDDFFKRAKLR